MTLTLIAFLSLLNYGVDDRIQQPIPMRPIYLDLYTNEFFGDRHSPNQRVLTMSTEPTADVLPEPGGC